MAELDSRYVIPEHIAAIMDGNGRWAEKRGLPRMAGHSAGSETFRNVSEYLNVLGVKYFTVYAFSTENWKRPRAEVQAIMRLLDKYLKEAIDSMLRRNIGLHIWGDTSMLSFEIRKLIATTDELSNKTTGLQVNLCVNYGGRADIVRAAKKLAQDYAGRPDDMTEQALSERLYSGGIPDPDFILRTGAEKRISNFLLWQCAYSELIFSDVLWPDVTEDTMNDAIIEYNKRNRRFGGV